MALDATTESIAHFIGLFEIAADGDRLRQAYKEFSPEKFDPESLGELGPLSVRLQAPYDLEVYHPGLAYQPGAPSGSGKLDGVYPGARTYPDAKLHEHSLERDFGAQFTRADERSPDHFVEHSDKFPDGSVSIGFSLPLPSSIAAVTWQSAFLQDDDFFRSNSDAGYDEAIGLHAAFKAMVEESASLAAFEAPSPFEDDWAIFAAEAIARTQSPTPPLAAENLEAEVKQGADATGVFVDGERLEKLPIWSDYLPKYFRSDAENDGAKQGGAESGSAEANSAAENETSGAAVAGEANSVEGSTKVAALPAPEDLDSEGAFSRAFEGLEKETKHEPPISEHGHKIVTGANTAINEVAIKSSWLDAPVFVVRGDVVKVEAVSQVNVLVEHDDIEGTDDGPLSTAKNAAQIINTSAEQSKTGPQPEILPENWHVTRVTGDVVQVNWVEQKTFATDFDRAVVESAGSSTYLLLGENEIVNAASFSELGYFYDVIFVAGDLIDVSMVSQTNLLFDSDRITAADGYAGTVTAADNLLYNQAVLKTTGVDEIVEMKSNLAAAAEELAAGAETFAREVAQDSLFMGTEFLRALHIDGSFVTANLLKQENMIGDADRITLEMQAMRDNLETEIVAGSNALVNLASIEKLGIDSKIMAAGQVYQEAMLYQAELIERDALPTGVGLKPLATEAVAFLADGMIDAEKGEDQGGISLGDDGTSADLMQTMLS